MIVIIIIITITIDALDFIAALFCVSWLCRPDRAALQRRDPHLHYAELHVPLHVPRDLQVAPLQLLLSRFEATD